LLLPRQNLRCPKKQVPYTFQTLGVFISTFFLGVWATVAVGLYLILGAAGGHVFAQDGAGVTPLVDSFSSGFLWGFLITAFVVGFLVSWRGWDRNLYTWIIATCIGWVTTFLPGLAFFAHKVNGDWDFAVQQALVPFLPAEAIKFAIVTVLIPTAWFVTSRTLNVLDPRTAIYSSLKTDVLAFFHPKLISF